MKLRTGIKVIHKFNGRVTTVNNWDDIGINPSQVNKEITHWDMFHGNYRKYTLWDKINNLFTSNEFRKA